VATVVAEYRYEEPSTVEQYERDAPRLADCLEVREASLVRTHVSRDRRRRISVFQAADAESVRNAHRSSNVRFEAIWTADESS
jgi:hypothetical protein